MKPIIKNQTVIRIQKMIDEPISRGFDSAINKCLDELDKFKLKQKEKGN